MKITNSKLDQYNRITYNHYGLFKYSKLENHKAFFQKGIITEFSWSPTLENRFSISNNYRKIYPFKKL